MGFQQLWRSYKPTTIETTIATPIHTKSSFDDDIGTTSAADEYDTWPREPAWTANQYKSGCTVVQYWLQLKPKYPNLSQLALDVVTIPASSADCERVFSSTGDKIEPQRREMGSQLLAALICFQRWIRTGFKPPNGMAAATYTDTKLNEQLEVKKNGRSHYLQHPIYSFETQNKTNKQKVVLQPRQIKQTNYNIKKSSNKQNWSRNFCLFCLLTTLLSPSVDWYKYLLNNIDSNYGSDSETPRTLFAA